MDRVVSVIEDMPAAHFGRVRRLGDESALLPTDLLHAGGLAEGPFRLSDGVDQPVNGDGPLERWLKWSFAAGNGIVTQEREQNGHVVLNGLAERGRAVLRDFDGDGRIRQLSIRPDMRQNRVQMLGHPGCRGGRGGNGERVCWDPAE
jgi:hypothetical protein